MERKRRRADQAEVLRRLARAGGGSIAGLSNIIAELQRSAVDVAGMPAHRAQVGRSLLQQFDGLKHTIEMPLSGAGEFSWELVDPALLLMESVRRSPALAEAYQRAATLRPPSADRPWSIIVAYDEFAPGNKLQVAGIWCK